MPIYCGNNRFEIRGRRLGTPYECLKKGIGYGLHSDLSGYNPRYEPIFETPKIYCGNGPPPDNREQGTPAACLRKGVGVGKKIQFSRNFSGGARPQTYQPELNLPEPPTNALEEPTDEICGGTGPRRRSGVMPPWCFIQPPRYNNNVRPRGASGRRGSPDRRTPERSFVPTPEGDQPTPPGSLTLPPYDDDDAPAGQAQRAHAVAPRSRRFFDFLKIIWPILLTLLVFIILVYFEVNKIEVMLLTTLTFTVTVLLNSIIIDS